MVQVLPGFAPQLGENLASILGSVQHVIDPQWEDKQFVKSQIIKNPEYAQKLANFAYQNPEAYKAMGLGKIGDTIGEISPDLKTVMEEAKKGYVKAEIGKPINKELAQSAVQTGLYGQTQEEHEKEKNESIQSGVSLALARQNETLNKQRIAENTSKIAALDLEAKGVAAAAANYPGLMKLDLNELAENYVNKGGKIDASLMTQINSVPQLKDTFDRLVNIKEQQRQYRNQVNIANIRSGKDVEDASLDAWIRSGRAGTPALWKKYATDPATQKRLFELVADPKLAKDANDQMLLQMWNSIAEKQLGRNSSMVKTIMGNINKNIMTSRTGTSNLQTVKDNLNLLFTQYGESTGHIYNAVIEETKKPDTSHAWQRSNEGTFRRIKLIDTDTMEEIEPHRLTASASGVPTFTGMPQPVDSTLSGTDNAINARLRKAGANVVPVQKADTTGLDMDKVRDNVNIIYNSAAGMDKKTAAIRNSKNLNDKEKVAVATQFGIPADSVVSKKK